MAEFSLEKLRACSIQQLKEMLDERKVNYQGVVEKEELVLKLRQKIEQDVKEGM